MHRQGYGSVLEGLDASLEFCRSLGLSPDRSRFWQHRQRLEHLIQAIKPDSEGRVDPENLKPFTDLEYVMALTESTELGGILSYLRIAEATQVRGKLAKVLGGPVLPSDEDPASNEARNILFELNMAARLWQAGARPQLGRGSDVRCEVADTPLLVECKRPFSPEKISRRIRDAEDQLNKRLKSSSPGSRGLIAISVSKILNPGDKFLVYRGEAQGRDGLSRHLERLAEKVQNRWRSVGRKIIGVLFHAITPALDEEADMYVVAQQSVVYHFSESEGTRDAQMIGYLRKALESIAY